MTYDRTEAMASSRRSGCRMAYDHIAKGYGMDWGVAWAKSHARGQWNDPDVRDAFVAGYTQTRKRRERDARDK